LCAAAAGAREKKREGGGDMAESNVFCMDCMEAMREFPDKFFDLAVVDPQYGLNITGRHKPKQNQTALVGGGAELSAVTGSYGKGRPPIGGGNDQGRIKKLKIASTFYHAFDDSSPPDAEYFRELKRVSKRQIIWGGNFFDGLGPTSCMIVWDKKRRGMDQADCEIAWTNLQGQSRIFEFRWNGMLQGDMANKEERIHPTQKPVALYRGIFQRYAKSGDKILDTHLGSGSSRIAAYDAGLDFWGYEIDKTYFDMMQERFERHANQENLFLQMGI
jgi:site-specific DNA-methyltransferase (adenine-specific)